VGRLRIAVFLSLAVLASLSVASDPECAQDHPFFAQVEKMVHANEQLSYRAIALFTPRGAEPQRLRIEHRVINGIQSERVTAESLDGHSALELHRSHPAQCLHPAHTISRGGLLQAACTLLEQYDLRMGEGRIEADRATVELRFAPRDLYRYGYIMRLDASTGLLLAQDTVSPRGELLEEYRVEQLDMFSDSPDDAGQLSQARSGAATASVVLEAHSPQSLGATAHSQTLALSDWQMGWLPTGFVALAEEVGASSRLFTNGLAVFSVALEAMPPQIGVGEGVIREGSMLSYTRGFSGGGAPYLVVVVGELPLYAARMIAADVRAVP
jgi:sigma-E factor negative regulatory protein RseB